MSAALELQDLAGPLPATDWQSVGLLLAGVGAFLIGIALLTRGHGSLVEELFGQRRPRLARLREALFQRALLVVGFTWLALGFALELLGHLRPAPEAAFPVAWSAAILFATALMLALSWSWAARAARRALREHLTQSPYDLRQDMALARELGELFGVPSQAEDTVGSYLERLHAAIGIQPPAQRRRPTPPLFEVEELEESR